MECRPLALTVAFAVASAGPAFAAERSPVRAVVELFTSQGCSSCPAADKLIGEMAADPSLLVMSLPIDYWDYLGWKDTLAKSRHTERQRGYAQMRGDREVYTPQVVVDGMAHVLGSDRAAIERLVATPKLRAAMATAPLTLTLAGDKLTIAVAADASEHAKGEIWLCALSKHVSVAIGRGENRGHTVTYHNVVRRWLKIGDWTGTARSWTLPASEFAGPEIDAVAVIVQDGSITRPGGILGAGLASLH